MYFEAVFSFYVLLYHFVGHSLFGLVAFCSLSNIIKRNFSLTLTKLNFYVDMSVWLFVGKQYYRLNVHRLWKLINSANFLQFISVITQKSQIPCKCRTVATYINHSFWLHLKNCFKQHLITAFTWWINNDHIRINTIFLIFSRQNFLCFSNKKFHILDMINLCVSLCVFNCCRNNLHTTDKLCLLGKKKRNCSDSTVQIPYRFFTMKIRIFQCFGIQLPGLLWIYLEK